MKEEGFSERRSSVTTMLARNVEKPPTYDAAYP
jgi:hypothetical protein